MQTGIITIRACPTCGHHQRERTELTGHTVWPVVWTDGWSASSGIIERLELLKCPRCAAVFRADDAPLVERCAPWEADQRHHNVPTAKAPSADDYAGFLCRTQLAHEIERRLRARAWRVFNDPWRKKPEAPFALPEPQRLNMERLLALLDDPREEIILVRAELLRQLGRFEECAAALATVKRAELAPRAGKIQELAHASERRVAAVK